MRGGPSPFTFDWAMPSDDLNFDLLNSFYLALPSGDFDPLIRLFLGDGEFFPLFDLPTSWPVLGFARTPPALFVDDGN